jgi:hypothetical protein
LIGKRADGWSQQRPSSAWPTHHQPPVKDVEVSAGDTVQFASSKPSLWALVMMVAHKLSRNPNTYASLRRHHLGLRGKQVCSKPSVPYHHVHAKHW